MLARTGNHGKGVEHRLLEMSRTVEFNCTSPSPVWEDRDWAVAQYSATEYQRATADVRRVSALAARLVSPADNTVLPQFSIRRSLNNYRCTDNKNTVKQHHKQTCTPDFDSDLLCCFAFFRSEHKSHVHITNSSTHIPSDT